eukprot:scaffold1951_cov258-Pinguiococcus_pyrenoidosus.AAC.4
MDIVNYDPTGETVRLFAEVAAPSDVPVDDSFPTHGLYGVRLEVTPAGEQRKRRRQARRLNFVIQSALPSHRATSWWRRERTFCPFSMATRARRGVSTSCRTATMSATSRCARLASGSKADLITPATLTPGACTATSSSASIPSASTSSPRTTA